MIISQTGRKRVRMMHLKREKVDTTSETDVPARWPGAGLASPPHTEQFHPDHPSGRIFPGSIVKSLTVVSLALITISSPEGGVTKPFFTASCQTTTFCV